MTPYHVRRNCLGRVGCWSFVALVAAACAEPTPVENAGPIEVPLFDGSTQEITSYLLIGNGGLPDGLESAVVAAGGAVDRALAVVGVAMATSEEPGFADAMADTPGLAAVFPDFPFLMAPTSEVHGTVGLAEFGSPPNSGDDDFFFDLQWGHDAIDAPEAWEAGARGAGVRVAILDNGIDAVHPDLEPNLNKALSTSFIAGEPYDMVPTFPTFNHGSHVAGIVAAADNAFGTIGVAPEAEIVAIKVLSAFGGTGTFGGLIAGLVYAAEIETDVANISLGSTLSRRGGIYDANGDLVGDIGAAAAAALLNSIGAATRLAHSSGMTIVAAAGNAATNGEGDQDRVHLPSDLPHVLSVAATAPHGWAIDSSTDLDVPAGYTNYGQSVIDFAAPGGNFDPAFSGQLCTLTFITAPCSVFDLVWNTTSTGYTFSLGTSMATPHVTGVAALIIGQNGGSMHPAQVKTALSRGADDLGKSGNDDFFGGGRVNAAASVRD